MSITNDMVNDFFSPKPIVLAHNSQKENKYTYEKHFVGSSSFASTRAASGVQTPGYSNEEVRFYEQQMTLSTNYEE